MSITEVISNPRVRQWLPGVLNGGMLILLTASLAQWTWLMAKPPLAPLVIAPSSSMAPGTAFSVQPLLSAHLFGQASQELTARRLDNIPVSSLNLILTGVIASLSGGYALISVNGQTQESFGVGQTITGGAVLHAVYSDRVVIARSGVLESLLLEGVDNSQPPQDMVMAASRSAGLMAPVVQEIGGNNYMVSRDKLAEQMRTPEFLKQATMVPSPGGGFLVRNVQPNSLYGKLGLRTGDVIKSVNGQPINTAEDAMKLYHQLSSINSVQLEITRSGRSEMLNYQFGQN